MCKFIFLLISSLLHISLYSQFTIRIQVTDYFNNKDYKNERLFVAGSFNSWNPGDSNFKMYSKPSGVAYADIKLPKGVYEYKITRGSWNKVECKSDGSAIQNRVFKIESDTTISITIEGLEDNFKGKSKLSSANKNVAILDTAFLIPQLNRYRRIWIYLPDGYVTSDKRYPVLYMHDGQNVFDDVTSFSGEWGVDECLDTMKKKCIVVAIDNGGDKRLNEYCPYDFSLTEVGSNSLSGKGEGKEYVDFLVKNLKPFIDQHYRTMKGKKNTLIAGSSMGGLISMYAILKYPKVFGAAGIFSPAFWVGPEIFNDINKRGFNVKGKIFFYAGELEGEKMIPDILKAYKEMTENSKTKMKIVINKEGKHNEQAWRNEFPEFYKWIKN